MTRALALYFRFFVRRLASATRFRLFRARSSAFTNEMRAPIVRAALDRPRPEIGEELRRLYDADQSDRDSRRLRPDLWERDRARRRRVQELIDSGALVSAEDHYHAAMVFSTATRSTTTSGRTNSR